MRVVAALLAMEVTLGVASAAVLPLYRRRIATGASERSSSCWPRPRSSVPSTEKCSLESRLRTCDRLKTATKNLFAISPLSSRSRFLQNTVASHTAWSAGAQRTSGTADYN